MEPISPENPSLIFHSAKPSQFKSNPFDRYIAAEIEVASMNRFDHGNGGDRDDIYDRFQKFCNKWGASVVHDGSLPSTGFEINTGPANGDLFVQQINEVCGILKEYGGSADRSCGLHVHLDSRDFTVTKMIAFSKLWPKVEGAMFSLLPRARMGSNYCKPVGNKLTKALVDNAAISRNVDQFYRNIYDALDPVNVESMKMARRPHARYYSINLHSWIYRGTVENRMHHGTVDAQKIINWSLLNAALLDVAPRLTEADLKGITADDGLAFLVAIAPDQSVKDWVVDRYKFFARNSNGGRQYPGCQSDTRVELSEQ